MPRKASSCGLGRPWGRSPCGLPWVSRVVPPTGLMAIEEDNDDVDTNDEDEDEDSDTDNE